MQHFIDACVLFICSNELGGSSNANSLALMEFYMKKATQEEKLNNLGIQKMRCPLLHLFKVQLLMVIVTWFLLDLHSFYLNSLNFEFSLCKCNNLLIASS